jgi:hypothetical protein
MRIFMEIEHIKNQEVTFGLIELDHYFLLWSGHKFGQPQTRFRTQKNIDIIPDVVVTI